MSDSSTGRDLLVGVDVGGTKIAVLVVDRSHSRRALSQLTTPTILDSPEAGLANIIKAVHQGVEQAGASAERIAALGLGVPGRVNSLTGLVRRAVNLGWEELPVGEYLHARLGVPCFLENDVTLAAVGARHYMGGLASRNMAYLSVGTGIAAGLILDGRVYRGAHGMAGEIGHMVIDPAGPVCQCGAQGCLEAVAAGPAIARLGEAAKARSGDTLLRNYPLITAESVYQAAREGDAAATGIIKQVSKYLAQALQQLIVAYDVECIVFGGGVSREGDTFFRPILAELARLREHSVLTGEMLQPDMIRLLPPDYHAGAWGAVILAGGGFSAGHPTGTTDGHSEDREPITIS
ncbi:MAG TPA: ROK family protein [Chloroflexia bacterium]|nr:ROK family protein [Chloroflexia bacterium]